SLGHGDGEAALRLASSIWFFWVVTGAIGEGRSWLGRALVACPDHAPTELRVRAQRTAALMAAMQVDPPAASGYLDQVTSAASPQDSPQVRADRMRAAGLAAGLRIELQECIDRYDAVLREVGMDDGP